MEIPCDYCLELITVDHPGVVVTCPKKHVHKFHMSECLSAAVVGGCWSRHFSFVSTSANDQTPEQTLLVGTYEWGRLIEYQHKARVYGPQEVYYCEENQKKEMADHISMCRMYCEQRGWDYDQLMRLGEEAYAERMEDIKLYGINNHKG